MPKRMRPVHLAQHPEGIPFADGKGRGGFFAGAVENQNGCIVIRRDVIGARDMAFVVIEEMDLSAERAEFLRQDRADPEEFEPAAFRVCVAAAAGTHFGESAPDLSAERIRSCQG
jgi:hypothetical protein